MNKLKLANTGAGAVSGAAGAAIGLVGGPIGSVAGAVVGSLMGDMFKDVAARMLSHRERVRIDNATVYISDGIQEGFDAGLMIRQDDFFQGDNNFTSDAAELLEGVLLKCKAQYQEKKVRLIANLFKNVAFDASVSAETAYQLLNLVDGLSYHHLCQIAYYGRRKEFIDFQILSTSFGRYRNLLAEENFSAAGDLLRLFDQRIFEDKDEDNDKETVGYGTPTAITPSQLRLAIRGRYAFSLLELQRIPMEDVLKAVKPLEYQVSWGADELGEINGKSQEAS